MTETNKRIRRAARLLTAAVLSASLLFASCGPTDPGSGDPSLSASDPQPSADSGSQYSSASSPWSDIPLSGWDDPDDSGPSGESDETEAPGESNDSAESSEPQDPVSEPVSDPVSSEPPSKDPVHESSSPQEHSTDSSRDPEESDVPTPAFTRFTDVAGIRVWFPDNWTDAAGSDCLLEGKNAGGTAWLTVDRSRLSNATGLKDETVTEGMLPVLQEQFPSSSGYSVKIKTVSMKNGKHTVIAVSNSRISGMNRQQAYFLRGNDVVVVTVSADRASDLPSVWKMIQF